MPLEQSLTCPYCEKECRVGYGKCHCGCGADTSLATTTIRKRGDIKGKPVKLVRGHARVQERIDTSQMGRFKISGVYCRLIALTMGLYAIVEEQDYSRISKYFWFSKKKRVNGHYAARHPAGRDEVIYMHREVMCLSPEDEEEVDHVDPLRTLENTRNINLRLANGSNQRANMMKRVDNKSGYKGVCWDKSHRKWLAQCQVNGKNRFLGYFDDPHEAHEVYKRAAEDNFGEFARFE
jgi:hypothetical protein